MAPSAPGGIRYAKWVDVGQYPAASLDDAACVPRRRGGGRSQSDLAENGGIRAAARFSRWPQPMACFSLGVAACTTPRTFRTTS
jgi:hypothetical protein